MRCLTHMIFHLLHKGHLIFGYYSCYNFSIKTFLPSFFGGVELCVFHHDDENVTFVSFLNVFRCFFVVFNLFFYPTSLQNWQKSYESRFCAFRLVISFPLQTVPVKWLPQTECISIINNSNNNNNNSITIWTNEYLLFSFYLRCGSLLVLRGLWLVILVHLAMQYDPWHAM